MRFFFFDTSKHEGSNKQYCAYHVGGPYYPHIPSGKEARMLVYCQEDSTSMKILL